MNDYGGEGWKASLETDYPSHFNSLLLVCIHFLSVDFFDFYCCSNEIHSSDI